MENNTKTMLSLTKNRDGNCDCVWDDPSEVAKALAQVITCTDKGDKLLKIILCALAIDFALGEDCMELFVSLLSMKTEQVRHALKMRAKKIEEE